MTIAAVLRMSRRVRSVRARVTAGATLVVAAVLLALAASLLAVLHASLEHARADFAEGRAEDIAVDLAIRPLGGEPLVTGDRFTVAQILDRHGRVIAASSPTVAARPVAAVTAPPGGDAEATVGHLDVGPAGRHRVVAVATDGVNGPLQVIVATSLETADHAVKTWAVRLAVALPLLVALVGALTWWAMGRALAPVERMRRELDAISPTDRHRRVVVPDSADEVEHLGRTMNDLLDRLAEASDRQRQFTADASHELRSPLAAMRVQLEGALARPELAAWECVANDVLTDQQRVERLVQDLLLLARLDGPTPVRPHAAVELTEIVAEEIARCPDGASPAVVGDLQPPCRVWGDPGQLGRVVRNLVDNAQRHARQRVAVAVRADGDAVVLSVVDDGPGIAPADRARIFERFVRLDASRHRDAGGSGLGLAIVREIAGAHDGAVAVAEHDGGARFDVRLPRTR